MQGITDAVGIAAGRDMTYAIRSNGQLWGWGRNDEGQLGDGTTDPSSRAGPRRHLTNVKQRVTGGRDHGVAVLERRQCLGLGLERLRPGRRRHHHRPRPLLCGSSPSGIADAAAGAHHSYALRTNGTVASWGRNYRTELGDGTGTSRRTPGQRARGQRPRSRIGSGRDMGNVTLGDGRVQAWGHNLYGQLGDGTTTNRTSAIVVPGVTNAVKAAGGGSAYGVVLVGDTTTPPPNQPPVARITGTPARTSPAR